MTAEIVELTTPAPPAGTTFAAVQIEATADGKTWRIVGAEPTREVILDEDGNVKEERLLPQIQARCRLAPGDAQLRCLWLCEDSQRGIVHTGPTPIGAAHGDDFSYGGRR